MGRWGSLTEVYVPETPWGALKETRREQTKKETRINNFIFSVSKFHAYPQAGTNPEGEIS